MKIGIFTDTYFPQVNGVTYTISLWKEKLEEMGNDVYIYYPKSSDYEPKNNEFPFKSMEFRFYEGYRVAFPTSISDKAKDLDIVHIHGLFTMAIAGLYVSRKFKIPKILTYHTPADEYIEYITRKRTLKKTLMKLYNFWEKKLLNSCNVVTCPSDVIRQRLLEKGVNDSMVLSNGVDLDFFKAIETNEFRKKYEINDDNKIIGFCGRMGYEKHIEDLINIADDFDGNILIAGRGPAEEHYRNLAKDKDNVKFLGFLNRKDILGFYSCIDLFVFPSTAETQGLVALESMACGTPLVGANELAIKETVVDGYTGYLYERGNLKDLMTKIEKVYKDRETLSKNCIGHVKQHSVDKSIDNLLEIYNKVLEE